MITRYDRAYRYDWLSLTLRCNPQLKNLRNLVDCDMPKDRSSTFNFDREKRVDELGNYQ